MATADAALADVAAAADIEAADDDHVDVAPSADVVAAAEAHVDVVAPTPPRRPSQRAHQWLPQPCPSTPPPHPLHPPPPTNGPDVIVVPPDNTYETDGDCGRCAGRRSCRG